MQRTSTMKMVAVTIQEQQIPDKLTDSQLLIIQMYFDDGHTHAFLEHFFSELYPNDTELVEIHLTKLFRPKLLVACR